MTSEQFRAIDVAMIQMMDEIKRAFQKFPRKHASAHEGFAVLKEELDELWDEVKINPKNRIKANMRKEAKQVAAMAIRFMVECCD